MTFSYPVAWAELKAYRGMGGDLVLGSGYISFLGIPERLDPGEYRHGVSPWCTPCCRQLVGGYIGMVIFVIRFTALTPFHIGHFRSNTLFMGGDLYLFREEL